MKGTACQGQRGAGPPAPPSPRGAPLPPLSSCAAAAAKPRACGERGAAAPSRARDSRPSAAISSCPQPGTGTGTAPGGTDGGGGRADLERGRPRARALRGRGGAGAARAVRPEGRAGAILVLRAVRALPGRGEFVLRAGAGPRGERGADSLRLEMTSESIVSVL